jgi:RNA polymerase sigma-70 factor (ECF subfamily)
MEAAGWGSAGPTGGEISLRTEFDARWRDRALAGDGEAVARLADAAVAPLYRFCFYRVGCDGHLCEDVVQETLVRAIRELEAYDPARAGGAIFGWLSGLARNEIRRALARERSGRRRASLEELWQRMDRELMDIFARLGEQALPEELLARDETRQMVNATMSQLPPHYSAALEAKYVTGQSVRGMADAFGLTEKAVESTLTRAREAFRRTFLALAGNLNLDAIA